MPPIDPLDTVLQDIQRALDAGSYLALVVALTLPGICAALEDPSGRYISGRDSMAYRDWYNAHLRPMYRDLTDVDCYSLRCGTVHQGKFGDPARMQYTKVLFSIPNPQQNVFHNIVVNDVLMLSW